VIVWGRSLSPPRLSLKRAGWNDHCKCAIRFAQTPASWRRASNSKMIYMQVISPSADLLVTGQFRGHLRNASADLAYVSTAVRSFKNLLGFCNPLGRKSRHR
jgi:hypothetical protein